MSIHLERNNLAGRFGFSAEIKILAMERTEGVGRVLCSEMRNACQIRSRLEDRFPLVGQTALYITKYTPVCHSVRLFHCADYSS